MVEKTVALLLALVCIILIAACIVKAFMEVKDWLKNDYNHKYYLIIESFYNGDTKTTEVRKVKARNENEAMGIYLDLVKNIEYKTKGGLVCWEWNKITHYSSVND